MGQLFLPQIRRSKYFSQSYNCRGFGGDVPDGTEGVACHHFSVDYPALVEVLRLALSYVRRLREMGKESYRIVKEEINLEKMVEVFVEALNSLN